MSEDEKEVAADGEDENKEQVSSVLDDLRPKYKPKKGDYQVQVHIIEARDLKGRGMGDMSDPVVKVEVFDSAKTTSIKKSTLNCTWDEVLYFEQKNMEPVRLEMEKVRVTINDANTFRRDVMIGAYEFDLSMVYFKKDHELYKAWVALSDVTSENDGVQGYLKLSITCLGPDDEMRMHDDDDDDDDEMVVLMPPHVEQHGFLLHGKIHDALDLPEMDEGLIGAKCDPFVQVTFGSLDMRTDTKKGQDVSFNQEVLLPVYEPTMSDSIKIVLYDYDLGRDDDLISQTTISYNNIKTNGFPSRWINFYGSPEDGLCKKIGRDLKINHSPEKMNKGLMEGSHYRGRLLCSFDVEEMELPRKGLETINGLADNELPETTTWVLQADIYTAIEVPEKGDWSLEVTCGKNTFSTSTVHAKNGVCKWYTSITKKKSASLAFKAPADPEQVPDVFIYLRRKKYRVSYYRYKFTDVLKLGFANAPRWLKMKEDKALDRLADDQFPGLVLMGLRGGHQDDVPDAVPAEARPFLNPLSPATKIKHKEEKKQEAPKLEQKEVAKPKKKQHSGHGNVSITFIQGKDLPIFDSRSKSSDPYVKLEVGHDKVKTRAIKKNLNPVWNETFEFKQVPLDTTLLPEIFDDDTFKDEKMGHLEIYLGHLSELPIGEDFVHEGWFMMENDQNPQSKVKVRIEFTFIPLESFQAPPEVDKKKSSFFKDIGNFADNITEKMHGHDEKSPKDLEGYFGEPETATYQVRAHIYQGRQLPALDRSGFSDPYVSVRCSGQSADTPVRESTLNPIWYVSKTFRVDLPTPLTMSPDIHVYVFDHDDIGKNEMMGHFNVSIEYAQLMNPSIDELDPVWFNLYDVDGNEVEGQILASFQILPIELSVTPLPILKPHSQQMWLEISTLGLRSLQSTFGVNKPRVEFELPNGKRFMTTESRVPSSTNPNYLQVLKIPLRVPTDRKFAPALNVEVRDILFGGWIKRRIGTSSLLLERYMQGDDSGEWKTGGQIDILDEKELEEEIAALEEKKRLQEAARQREEEERIAAEQRAIEEANRKYEQQQGDRLLADGANDAYLQADDDGNMGFAQIDIADDDQKVELIELEEKGDMPDEGSDFDEAPLLIDIEKETRGGAIVVDWNEKVKKDDEKPEYMKNRDIVDDELEDNMIIKPFDEIPIFTGSKNAGIFGSKFRKVGLFKGLIRLLREKEAPGGIDPKDLLAPKDVFVRLYVLRGRSLTPMDPDGASDPYLKVQLGDTTISTRSRYHRGTLSPDFYECFIFPCTIPGASQLGISVWDYDGIGDDMIGETIVDVEDRWFTKEWRLIKKKPVEWRTLHNPTSSMSQGKLECWVEILNPGESQSNPPEDISPPPIEEWELRVVMWKCKDVTIKDEITQQNDLYITGRYDIPDLRQQRTDTHLRSKKGKGSFNWRMKYPVKMPMKSPRFSIQIWDMDFFSANDSICEAYLSLKNLFRKAYKVKDRVMMVKDDSEKIWLEDLRHPNEPGVSQGKVQVSFELLPINLVEQLPAGLGRSDPNMNPVLPPPEGRISFNLFKPWQLIRDILGDDLLRKLCLALCCILLICFLVFVAPMVFSNLFTDLITGDLF